MSYSHRLSLIETVHRKSCWSHDTSVCGLKSNLICDHMPFFASISVFDGVQVIFSETFFKKMDLLV